MDILYIDQLVIMAKIGIHNWEKKCFQKLIIDLKISYDKTSKKNISRFHYLDYTQVNQIIVNIINARHFFLIEHVAETIAKSLINTFFYIYNIQIKVNKPGAIHNAKNVGICINRKKTYYSKKIKIYTGEK